MFNRFNTLSTNRKLALVICGLSLLFIVISLLIDPEWLTDPRWWVVLPVVAVSGAVGLLDSLSGARSLFESPTGVQLDEALDCYLDWVETTYRRLDLRGVEERQRKIHDLTLADIYISLRATIEPERDAEQQTEQFAAARQAERDNDLDMRDLLQASPHVAITGDPGCGKTTFLKIIASELAHAHRTGDVSRIEAHLGLSKPLPIPIFITLSDYNQYRRADNDRSDPTFGTIRGFINYHLRQRVLNVPDDFFDKLLDGETPTMLLLDGLDEIPNEEDRRRVSANLQTLHDNNQINYLIVTSRTPAYRGRVRLQNLRVAQVRPMSPEQVERLVNRWCKAVYVTPHRQQTETKKLHAAIQKLEAGRIKRNEPRLIETPLMVTVVAIVHHNQKKLPEERAALYAKCVDVLLADEHHLESEGAESLRNWGGSEAEKKQLLALLAFRMMEAGRKAGRTITEHQMEAGRKAGRTITEHQLEDWLLDEFERKYDDSKQAKTKLREFAYALTSRESLIREADRRYSFVHLTFQEFLAAFYLADVLRNADEIVEALQAHNRLTQSWWRETVLLTIGYLGLSGRAFALSIVERLAQTDGDAEQRLAAVELATTAFNELGVQDAKHREMLHAKLVPLLTTPNQPIQPAVRLLAGDSLSRLGDRRPGVGVVERNGVIVPDIAWGRWIEAGEYVIGADDRNAFDKQTITIEQSYRLAQFPITNVQFACFVQDDFDNPRWWRGMPEHDEAFEKEYALRKLGLPTWSLDNRPRENVSWYQAIAFCRWLRAKLGIPLDLPTDYEWEVAARLGMNGTTDGRVYPWGDTFGSNLANTRHANLQQTSAVGIFPDGANRASALYDMSGNVWEWCRNKSNDPHATQVDQSSTRRTLRGGSWLNLQAFARAAYRYAYNPFYRSYDLGFRVCVRRPPSQGR